MQNPIGYLSESPNHKTPYFAIRYNHTIAYMSDKPLGLQALVNFLDGSLVWINIKQEWIA